MTGCEKPLGGLKELAAKATPGPWTLQTSVSEDHEPYVGMVRSPKGWWEQDSTVLSLDNALLIALAPLMAETLIRVEAELREIHHLAVGLWAQTDPSSEECGDIATMVEAALALLADVNQQAGER